MEISPVNAVLSFQSSKKFQKLILTLSRNSHGSLLTKTQILVSFDLCNELLLTKTRDGLT